MKTLSNKLLKIKEGLYILMHIHLSMFYQFRIAEKIHIAVSTGFVNSLPQLIDGLVYHFIFHSPMHAWTTKKKLFINCLHFTS